MINFWKTIPVRNNIPIDKLDFGMVYFCKSLIKKKNLKLLSLSVQYEKKNNFSVDLIFYIWSIQCDGRFFYPSG